MGNAQMPSTPFEWICYFSEKAIECENKVDKKQHYKIARDLAQNLHPQFKEAQIYMPIEFNQISGSPGAQMGDGNVSIGNTIIQKWEKVKNDIDLPTLATELGELKQALRKAVAAEQNDDYEEAAVAVRKAEEAARASDGPGMIRYIQPVAGIVAGFLGKMAGGAIAPTVMQLIHDHILN